MKLGALTDPRHNLLDEIQWIAQNGFDFVDLVLEAPHAALESTDWKTVRAAIDDAGIGIICHAAHYLPIDNPSPHVRQAALDELRRSIDAAQLLGATLCTTRHQGWPSHLTEELGYEYYRQLYEILIKHGAERGVAVALENSQRNQHQLKHFREIFHRQPGLKLHYNIGHGNIQTNAPHTTRDYLFALSEHLIHVHLGDNNGITHQHLPFGAPQNGGIDLMRELRTLRSFRYDNTITLDILGDRRWLLACAVLVRDDWIAAN